ncbi:hypothetical protein [Chryseobacterium sp. HR92]|uniref:hypothetical protein n=1 Tax=Chryseobacterium sp. HR92 TaxID=3094839 RepID=UPI00388EAF18|nr:hypothetical protein SFA27_13485 [Chryseobacterium sp. HR92]
MKKIEKKLLAMVMLIIMLPFTAMKAQQCNEVVPTLNLSMSNEFSHCPGINTSINTKVISGDIPQGAEVRWYDNPNASGSMVNGGNITQTGTYYAFYYHMTTSCYSLPSDPVSVILLSDTPVYLNNKARYFGFGQTFNLIALEDTSRLPVGVSVSVKWYSDASGTVPVPNPALVNFTGPSSPGLPPTTKTFYTRYEQNFNGQICKGPLQAVEIKKIAPFPQVRLYTDTEFDDPAVTGGMGYRISICEPIDLTLLEVPSASGMVTPGTVVKWYSVGSVNADLQINANVVDPSYWTNLLEVPNPHASGGGTVFPRYYDPAIDYYGPKGYHDANKAYHQLSGTYRKYASPRLNISSNNVPPTPCTNLPNGGEPFVLMPQLTVCPGEKADLTVPGIIQPWTSGGVNINPPNLYWYTNDHHGGDPVADPSAVEAGIYYPFYYYSEFKIFRPIRSTSTVTVVEKLNCNECTKPGNTSVPADISLIGISSLENQPDGWPQHYSAFIVLGSKTKGFVMTRIAGTSQITNPVEGMLIYDTVEGDIKLYNGSIWKKIEKSCNE